jgi:hypothetical protein
MVALRISAADAEAIPVDLFQELIVQLKRRANG